MVSAKVWDLGAMLCIPGFATDSLCDLEQILSPQFPICNMGMIFQGKSGAQFIDDWEVF